MQLSAISLAITRIGRSGGFSPLSLFASGEQGAWYDPSDLSTMFQDSAGTTPVTADGQTVGKILDKSGRGNHASQATAASRPLYKTDGTYHWLQFDGVDDSLSTAAINFTSTNKMSVFSGLYLASALSGVVCQNGPIDAFSGSFSHEFGNVYWFGATGELSIGANGSTGMSVIRTSTTPAPGKRVFSGAIDLSGGTIGTVFPTFRYDGVSRTGLDSGTLPGNRTFISSSLCIGASESAFNLYDGRIYALIVRGALSTAQQITDTETWVNQRTGAY